MPTTEVTVRTAEDAQLRPIVGDVSTHKKQVRKVTHVCADGLLCVLLTTVGGKRAAGRRMSVQEWSEEPQKWTWIHRDDVTN